MQAVPSTFQQQPLASRVYGVRLLYLPEARRRLSYVVLVLLGAYYLQQAVNEFAGLGQKLLKFDFEQFRQAAMDLDAGQNPYQVFLGLKCTAWCLGGYVYSPLLAEIIRPLDALPERTAAGVWIAATHVLLLASLALILWALRRDLSTTAILVLLAFGLVFQPVFDNLAYMQVGTLLLLVMAGAAVLYIHARPATTFWAGALIALAAILKVTPILAVPAVLPPGWARARGAAQRLSVRETLAGIAGLLAAVIVVLGAMLLLVPHTADFFFQVLPRLAGGTTGWENKSLPAFFARTFVQLGQPYSTPIISVTTILLIVGPVFALTALVAPGLSGNRNVRAASLAAFIAAVPIASIITWHHHLVLSLLAIILLAPSLWPRAGGRGVSRVARWLVILSYPLMYVEEVYLQAFTLNTGIAHPSTFDVVLGTVMENANLWGMLALWLASILVLVAAVRGKAVEPNTEWAEADYRTRALATGSSAA